MAKGTKQKWKLIYLIRILLEKTDDTHSMTMQEILAALADCDVSAERKSIYADIDMMRDMGIDVIGEQIGSNYYYHVANRRFELAELKLLVDAIQSSKFITEKKSIELIKKLGSLTSVYEAKQLQRQVYLSGRVKTVNENIYYNIDEIHNAIASNCKINFQYFKWNVRKEWELQRAGKIYKVSPWALVWDDENYYMIGYDKEDDKIKHYRVDKMIKINRLKESREGDNLFEEYHMAAYVKKNFSMFGGEEQYVKLLCNNNIANVIVDRFGKEITLLPVDENHFKVNVQVMVSKTFFGWIFSLGDEIKILGPDNVVKKMKEMLEERYESYL